MDDKEKTKKQLVSEINQLKEQIIAFEKSEQTISTEEQMLQNTISTEYRDLVENLTEVIYILDENGSIMYINPSITSFLGYKQTNVIGMNIHNFILKGRNEKYEEKCF